MESRIGSRRHLGDQLPLLGATSVQIAPIVRFGCREQETHFLRTIPALGRSIGAFQRAQVCTRSLKAHALLSSDSCEHLLGVCKLRDVSRMSKGRGFDARESYRRKAIDQGNLALGQHDGCFVLQPVPGETFANHDIAVVAHITRCNSGQGVPLWRLAWTHRRRLILEISRRCHEPPAFASTRWHRAPPLVPAVAAGRTRGERAASLQTRQGG